MVDIVIPYRTSRTDELRYSLRSIARHIPNARVFISGDCPDWAQNVIHLSGTRKATAIADVCANVIRACSDVRINDKFILWNDDMMQTAEYDGIPAWHEDDLGTVAKKKLAGSHTRPQGQILADTNELLLSMGEANPVSYALHIPMGMDTQKALEVYTTATRYNKLVSPRTLYGNIYGDPSSCHDDVKVYSKTARLPKPFASTWDSALGVAYSELMAMYPDKCKFEK